MPPAGETDDTTDSNEESPQPPIVKALKHLEQEIIAGRIRLYRSLLGRPSVFAAAAKDGGAGSVPGINCGIFDRDFWSWLTTLLWERLGIVLRKREQDRLLSVLDGWSMRDPSGDFVDADKLRLLETEPVVTTVVVFMEDKVRHETRMEALRKELFAIAVARKVTKLGNNRFPAAANVLSKKLHLLREQIKLFGIEFDDTRSNGCKIAFWKSDGSAGESSAGSSAPKPGDGAGLSPADDRAAAIASLKARPQQGKESHDKSVDDTRTA